MQVTTESFERDVVERSCVLPVVVDFWSELCSGCRALAPALAGEVAKRAGRLALVHVDIHAERELAARFGIRSIPAVTAFRDGEPVAGFAGACPPAMIGQFLDELLEPGRTSA